MVSKEHGANGDENLIINAINIPASDKFVICALVELPLANAPPLGS